MAEVQFPQWLIDALFTSGGPVNVTREHQPGWPVGLYSGTHNAININPWPDLLGQVGRHEISHALQDRTIGLENTGQVDPAIRQRLKLPSSDPTLTTDISENLANYVGNREAPADPLMNMVMRELTNNIFRMLATRRGQP